MASERQFEQQSADMPQGFIEGDEEKTDEAEKRLEMLKFRKARAKTAFTKTRNVLLSLLDDEECPSRRQIRETREKLSDKQEQAVAVIEALACEYSSCEE